MFPLIISKKPVGRQSFNFNKNKDSTGGDNSKASLIALAAIATDVYCLKHETSNINKSFRDIIKLLKGKYELDKTLKKKVEDIVNTIDLPIHLNKIDNDNANGTLAVSRYVHRSLKLEYFKYTKYEVRILMSNILKKVEQKDEGCMSLMMNQ